MKIGLALLAALFLVGCSNAGQGRTERLIALASAEAAGIPNVKDRFTRQLNIAELQLRNGDKRGARGTLGQAAGTIKTQDDKQLDAFTQLAGWVSISQLSRGADDKTAASAAIEQALAVLHGIEPASERCQYVVSLAREVRVIRGDVASVKLINEAGPWVASIKEQAERRRALMAFADELFTAEDYSAGQAMLHNDSDAAWRSDTLIAMAYNPAKYYQAHGGIFAAGANRSPMATEPAGGSYSGTSSFGKSLDYESNFKQK
ncbi:MAG TPA: hypothetical protein VIL86_01655 [Tepidisphaeraceae bacterium]|jgi:hypothetical protein